MKYFIKYFRCIMIMVLMAQQGLSQQVLDLYDNTIPNALVEASLEEKSVRPNGHIIFRKISRPTLTVFVPEMEKANGTAILICPGGGYGFVSYTNEGSNIAEAFASMGVTAFVLKYRLPFDSIMTNRSIVPLQDAQQALRLIRKRAPVWNVDPARVGIIGFSAGGHLASTVATHFDTSFIENREEISLRPDFVILGYPVISFSDSLRHEGSKVNLVGSGASRETIDFFSNELHVTDQTPPTYLFHAANDKAVRVENSMVFYKALKRKNVPAELLIYPEGGHGFGIHNKTSPEEWIEKVQSWMKENKWLD